jgi:glutathione S-transferase
VADINVAATLSPTLRTGFDISMHPNVENWLKACMARPNFTAAREVKVPKAA